MSFDPPAIATDLDAVFVAGIGVFAYWWFRWAKGNKDSAKNKMEESALFLCSAFIPAIIFHLIKAYPHEVDYSKTTPVSEIVRVVVLQQPNKPDTLPNPQHLYPPAKIRGDHSGPMQIAEAASPHDSQVIPGVSGSSDEPPPEIPKHHLNEIPSE